MRKIILLIAVFVITALSVTAQTSIQTGIPKSGPDLVIQKPVCAEFRGDTLAPLLEATQYRITLRRNTAQGDLLTVSSRHPWFRTTLYRAYSRNGITVTGDSESGYSVFDGDRIRLQLVPSGYRDEYLVIWG